MAAPKTFSLADLVDHPGTYFNPKTEVLVVVDDSPHIDSDLFDTGSSEEGDWVHVSDTAPIDEHARDELLERYQVTHGPDRATDLDDDTDDEEEEEDDGVEELQA